MDDGAQKWKGKSLGVRFCTDNFSLSEVNILMSILQDKYKLKCSRQKKDNNFRIYVSSHSYIILHSLIYNLFIPSMLYKFPICKHASFFA
jgi:hypothetical protein